LYYSELITPNNAAVVDVYNSVAEGLSDEEAVLALWDCVCRCIEYPMTLTGRPTDMHVLDAFVKNNRAFLGPTYYVHTASDDFWQFSHETIAWGGDCEDTSSLLCSLLRRRFDADTVFVEVGVWSGGGHAWVNFDGRIMETTLDSLPSQPWSLQDGYSAEIKYNDQVDPGYAFGKSHIDAGRLRAIGAAWGHRSKVGRRWRR